MTALLQCFALNICWDSETRIWWLKTWVFVGIVVLRVVTIYGHVICKIQLELHPRSHAYVEGTDLHNLWTSHIQKIRKIRFEKLKTHIINSAMKVQWRYKYNFKQLLHIKQITNHNWWFINTVMKNCANTINVFGNDWDIQSRKNIKARADIKIHYIVLT